MKRFNRGRTLTGNGAQTEETMLERRCFQIVATGHRGYQLLDGETAEVVGMVTPRPSPAAGWRGWFAAPRRERSDTLEVREPPDGSLVFTLTRFTRHAELSDGQDHRVWRFRHSPAGSVVTPAKGGVVACLAGSGRQTEVTTLTGLPMGMVRRAAVTRVELAARLDGLPFEKMLVLGVAFWVLMQSPPRRSDRA